MAKVYVDTWSEFVEAVGVSGDTVILPENAEWNMSEILPYGLSGNVSIACSKIDGRGTRIKNLNLMNYGFVASGQDIKYFRNLLMTDWIGTNSFFDLRYGSDWFCCAISGITSNNCIVYNQNSYSYSAAKFVSTSINVESSANNFKLCDSGSNNLYCRIEVHAPNSTNSEPAGSENNYCEMILYVPNASGGFYSFRYKGCTVRGNMQNIASDGNWIGSWTGQPSVYFNEMFAVAYEPRFPDHFISCTESELKDAAYLRSKGFPIIVSNGGG